MVKLYFIRPDDFEIACEVSTVFIEYDKKILVLLRAKSEESCHTWGIPGGKLEGKETPLEGLIRELQEELSINPDQQKLEHKLSVFVEHSQIKYQLHLYIWKLDTILKIHLNPQEHIDYMWQPIDLFKQIPLLEAQAEAFSLVYKQI